jgi:predicted DNA-binding protein (MmcQ/YjbR family)
MNVDQLKAHCASLPGVAERLYQSPINVHAYQVGGKSFSYFKTSNPERWRFSMRVAPERFLELTDMPGIKPAKYMARYHWITVVDVSSFPEDYLIELIEWSYQKAFNSLSKKKRHEIS